MLLCVQRAECVCAERWSEKLLKISDRAIVEAAVEGFKAYLDIPDYARRSLALGGVR